ncbi:MAG: MFS transporter [Clostridia bacterium]|nr:MFS transporter [Clostridia bacterium]
MQRRFPVRFALFLMAYYMTNAVFQGYASLYYTSIGFTSAQVGAIFAAIALVSVFSQPFWGICGDRVASRNRLIRGLVLAASASILCFLITRSFIPSLLLACLFSCFYTSIQPMGDSVILAALEKNGQPFGPLRLSGGMAFAVTSLVFGSLLNVPGREIWAVFFTAGLCLTMIPASYALPHTPGYQSASGKRMSFGALLKNKDLMRLMLFMLPMQMTMGYFYTFFSPLFLSFEGANGSLLGWCYFISAMGEIPYLLLSDKLYEKLGAGKLMCISACVLTLRWIILAMTDNVTVTLFSQLLHGWGFIVMTVSMAKHISRTVPAELQASGQMLLAMVSYGLARAVGNLGGGLLADAFGRQNVFYLMAAVCAVTLVCFAPKFLRRKESA